MDLTITLALLFLAAAILYSAVGHAGASGYLAAMAFMGIAPSVLKPVTIRSAMSMHKVSSCHVGRGSDAWPSIAGMVK
jgi:hypothetical protein